MIIYGLDFTSAPGSKKPIALARCELESGILTLESVECLFDFPSFEGFLQRPGPWVAGLDFPFGQPSKLIKNLKWGDTWEEYVRLVDKMGMDSFVQTLGEYREKMPAGLKQPLRKTDGPPAKSRSPMMLYGVPVGKMFLRGAPRLLKSGASILPGCPRPDNRIVLEAYPGLAVRNLVGKRSYKNDTKTKQTPERQAARAAIVDALRSDEVQKCYGVAVRLDEALAQQFIRDGSGDQLDALLCAVQAAWGYTQRGHNYGIPQDCDALEGWIVDPAMAKVGIQGGSCCVSCSERDSLPRLRGTATLS
jgi:hypothetical protein